MEKEETIAAIATALAPAGLGVIRLSGKNAVKITSCFFQSKKELKDLKTHQAVYGKIIKDSFVLDDAVVLVFKAPNSYTGEDVVEISCHGGLLILEQILKLCFENGAIAAQRGEFTKKAFLNGKLSLTQAEAVLDVISAQSYAELKAVAKVKEGALFKKTEKILNKLIEIDGHISVYLDYPDEDIEKVEIKKLKEALNEQKQKLEDILKNTKFESILKNGVNVSIVGNPNVGKSTLMNKICGEEKSIVTKISGTTRDVLKHSVQINGVNFIFSDTAGIRKTKDLVEKIGVEKAIKNLKEADVVFFVADSNTKQQDLEILNLNKTAKLVLIYNKMDLNYKTQNFKNFKFDLVLKTSKEDENSIINLKNKLFDLKKLNYVLNKDDILILNHRQKQAIKKAISNLEQVIEKLKQDCFLDAVGVVLEIAIENLLELTGKKVSDLVLDEIFSKFCVGK